MLVFPQRGLVVLSMPKCGTTALEQKLLRKAGVHMTSIGLKHFDAQEFARFVEPMLAHAGYPRESYETVCLFREPIDWLRSWWRYRSRDELLTTSIEGRRGNYSGNMSFDEFALAYVDQSAQPAVLDVAGQAAFVSDENGDIAVDRIFAYEDMPDFIAHIEEKIGRRVRLEQTNVSPARSGELTPETLARLRTHLEPEYRIHRALRSGAPLPTAT